MDGTLLRVGLPQELQAQEGSPDPPEGGTGSNPEVDFKGESRTNQTHQSTTDPDGADGPQGWGSGSQAPSHAGHVLMENRNDWWWTLRLRRLRAIMKSMRRAQDARGQRAGTTVGADKLYDQTKLSSGLPPAGHQAPRGARAQAQPHRRPNDEARGL
ncbi:MAG: hypothetical protein M9921_11585 [Fimbriimonadaceae bacterium]|nr:hypothetical protein [Fimbriimonadaceae bacterium]